MGEPACGKAGQELDINDKIEKPAAGKYQWVFDHRHGNTPQLVQYAHCIIGGYGAKMGRGQNSSKYSRCSQSVTVDMKRAISARLMCSR